MTEVQADQIWQHRDQRYRVLEPWAIGKRKDIAGWAVETENGTRWHARAEDMLDPEGEWALVETPG